MRSVGIVAVLGVMIGAIGAASSAVELANNLDSSAVSTAANVAGSSRIVIFANSDRGFFKGLNFFQGIDFFKGIDDAVNSDQNGRGPGF